MNAIVAVYADWGIGSNGTQPVVVPDDRRRFAELTADGTIITGRKTLEDFSGGLPLPGRLNIVLSRDDNLTVRGAIVVHSLANLFAALRGIDNEKIFVIGGSKVYRLLLPYCKRAFITKICANPPCDAFFPNLDELSGWSLAEKGEPFVTGCVNCRYDLYINNNSINYVEENTSV